MNDERAETIPMVDGRKDSKAITIARFGQKPSHVARGKALRQIIAAVVANLGNINTGMAFGFTATALPQLKEASSSIHITADEASWIAALSAAGTPLGCILSGYLMDIIGRRMTLIITEVPLLLGWTLIAAAQNVPMIYVGRLLAGLGSGMVSAPSGVYTCEVAQPHLRGMLGALTSFAVSFGVLLQYVIGSMVSWNILAAVNSLVPVVSLLSMLLMPESPNYLLNKGHRDRATRALARLRGDTCDVEEEIRIMVAFKEKNHVEPLKTWGEVFRALLAPSTLKPFGILSVYFFLYMNSGICVTTFHAVEVFETSGAKMDEYWTTFATITTGVVRLIFTAIGCVLCRRCGRRPLTFISAVGCGASMLALAVYMYFAESWRDAGLPPAHTWVPVTCIFGYTVACTIGFLIIPWLMIGEVYPTQVRGIVGGLTACVAHLSVFFAVKAYDMQRRLLRDYGAFALFGALSYIGLIFFYFFLPETKGRTLQEIEDYFCGRTKTLKKNSTASQSP